jgi:hypothetical protein
MEQTNAYGFTFDKFCECGGEHDSGKASDICFGDFSTDVAAYWCPKCGIKDAWQY